MFSRFSGVSPRAWRRVVLWTIVGPVACISICYVFVWFMLGHLQPADFRAAMAVATVLPIVIAGPLFFLHSLKLRELAIANHKLYDLASIDALTACLNRRAFQFAVDKRLNLGDLGAFLIIDADHFKAINDRYGHERGDEALRIIAAAIRGSIRDEDLCGRIGGEEFGVYMPNVTQAVASDVAERIRASIVQSTFAPRGDDEQRILSVSIGCAVHTRRSSYAELFAIADEQLYVAKEYGRNRVRLVTLDPAVHGQAWSDGMPIDRRLMH